jgi:hypothetical protein
MGFWILGTKSSKTGTETGNCLEKLSPIARKQPKVADLSELMA